MLIISPECSHVKPNMHNRIVKNHFIRGDHSLSPSSRSPSLSLSLSKCRLSGLSIHWSGMVCVCVCVCWSSACLHTPTRACFPGDTQLRVLGGWQRDGRVGGGGDRGVACRTRDGKGDLRGGEVMRGVAGGELRRGWQQSEARPGGWHGSGASLCPRPPLVPPGCFCGQHLQPALHAKHTLQRGRLHMGLRGPEEKHSWGSAGREGRWVSSAASLNQCLSQMKPWGDAVMRDERINSLQIILLWISSLFPCTINAIVFFFLLFWRAASFTLDLTLSSPTCHRRLLCSPRTSYWLYVCKTIFRHQKNNWFWILTKWGTWFNVSQLTHTCRNFSESQLSTAQILMFSTLCPWLLLTRG